MPKNAHIHLVIESEYLEILKKQAKDQNISISELARQKLRSTTQLMKIEFLLQSIIKKLDLQNGN